jgi:hypothetical protein
VKERSSWPAGTGLARLLFNPLMCYPPRHGQAGREEIGPEAWGLQVHARLCPNRGAAQDGKRQAGRTAAPLFARQESMGRNTPPILGPRSPDTSAAGLHTSPLPARTTTCCLQRSGPPGALIDRHAMQRVCNLWCCYLALPLSRSNLRGCRSAPGSTI